MDTRSVVRSRRRSSRLTGQPPQEERVKRATAGKRRDSDNNASSRASSDASREGSAAYTSPVSKSYSSNGAHQARTDTRATKAVVKTEDEEPALPLFPKLRSSRAKPAQAKKVETDRVAAQSDEPAETSSDEAIKGNAKAKAIKTGSHSTRLAIGSSEDSTKNGEDQVQVEVKEEQDDSSTMARRQNRRLASKTPDVEHDSIVVEPLSFHSAASETGETQAAAAKAAEDGARGFTAEQESRPDLRNPSTRASSEREPSTDPIHHEELPRRNLRPRQHLQGSRAAEDTSPIPELLADIETIVQSSPLASRASASESTKGPAASTPGVAGKKRAPASVATRSRSLRRSSRLGSEHTDSETSQFDGAFDDSIQGRRKKKAEAASDSTGIAPPKGARYTKRSAEEMAQDEGNSDTQRPRQRRKVNSDSVSKPAKPTKKPTPAEASSMNEPDGDDTSNVSESVRDDDEAEDSITVAPLPIIHVEEEDDPVDLASPAEGSSQESQQSQKSEEDEEKCADCGATRERYLVCAKCQKAIYCGKYCQIWNWPIHKPRCVMSEDAVEAEVAEQEAYLGKMWAGALRALEEGENNPGGMLESMLLGEAVGGSPTRGGASGQRGAGALAGLDGLGLGLGGAQSVVPDHAPVDGGRAMSIRLAQAALGEAE